MEKNPINNQADLVHLPRTILFIVVIVLTILFFFLRGGLIANKPLDQLARASSEPYSAMANGKPTIIEFYADWCEACKSMAPSMLSIEKQYGDSLDIVLLNVDNPRWEDFISKYKVNGIPNLEIFDRKGILIGSLIGIINKEQLSEIALDLVENKPIPDNITKGLSSSFNLTKNSDINQSELVQPRSHA